MPTGAWPSATPTRPPSCAGCASRIDALDRRHRRRCSTSAPSWRARPGGPSALRAAGRSATPSASARSCCGSRWRTTGPLPQADLLALYRRLIAATRALEARDRRPPATAPATTPDRTPDGPPRPRRRGATRFAPAPTGLPPPRPRRERALRVGPRRVRRGGRVLLRIEDHDRQRCGPSSTPRCSRTSTGSGSGADVGPVRQIGGRRRRTRPRSRASATTGSSTAATARARRSRAWAREHGRPWSGRGCPGGCRERGRRRTGRARGRSAAGPERGSDATRRAVRATRCADRAATCSSATATATGRTAFCVVVDDLRQGIDLVVRGRDLLDATARQIRLGRLLGRETPPAFAHHPLIRKPDGRKLSKSDGDTGVRELGPAAWLPTRCSGRRRPPSACIPEARPLELGSLDALFALRARIRPSEDSEAARDRSCERAASGQRPFGRARTG